jgi:nucleoside-diphosphate-sugar epimerase
MRNPLASDLDHILAHTSSVWEELEGARLFVTGGTGFFGCWLLESFAAACDEGLCATMTVLTRSPEAFCDKAPHLAQHRAIRLLRGDVRTFAFPQGRYTHVIHGAAEASARLNREQPLVMLDTILEGTRHTLEFAAAAGVKRFLMLSSGAVYGPQPADMERMPEDFRGAPNPADPPSAYAEGKRAAELLGSVYTKIHPFDFLIARCFAFVGPHLPLDTHFAIGNFIADCLHSRPIAIRGDGTPFRSYLYAADLAIWLWTILARGESLRPYNVGSEEAISIAELAYTVQRALGAKSRITIAEAPRPGMSAERYVPSTVRARRELRLGERIPLSEAIRRTAAWSASQAALALECEATA